jgi:hypothetical protein
MSAEMMQLGVYQFSISTAAYQELSRGSEYRWSAQERVGTNDALQFTGSPGETLELRGVIFPHFKGGLDQITRMRAQASLGIPLPLISLGGRVMGLWVVEAINEGQRIFERGGVPLRQEFEIRLRRYDGGLRSILPF